MSAETELAWAAGFFDGEGSCGAYRTPTGDYLYIRMTVNQIQPECLERFATAVGCGPVLGPYRHGRHAPLFRWQLSGLDKCARVYGLLVPYLGSIKRKQILQSLDAVRLQQERLGGAEGKAKRISAALMGVPHTTERRRNISIARRAAWARKSLG